MLPRARLVVISCALERALYAAMEETQTGAASKIGSHITDQDWNEGADIKGDAYSYSKVPVLLLHEPLLLGALLSFTDCRWWQSAWPGRLPAHTK